MASFVLTPRGPIERAGQLGLPVQECAPSSDIDWAVALMEQASARLADHCIASSQGVAEEIIRFYGVPRDRVTTVYNWCDPRIFAPRSREEAQHRLGFKPDRRYLLYVGHFRWNIPRGTVMREAMRLLPDDVTLVVIDPEPDSSVLQEFGSRVIFTGYLHPEEMAVNYTGADVLCFPAFYAGFGLVLVEAMACGCPPVVFDYAAMNEIVTSESGYLVAEPTATAYAAAVARALTDADSKREAAKLRARRFRLEGQVESVLRIYEDLVS